MNDLGLLHYLLIIQIIPHSSGVFLSQYKYALKLLEHANMFDTKATPTSTNIHFPLFVKDGLPLLILPLYKSIISNLLHLIFTNLNICYAINTMCQYMHAPTNVHLQSIKWILCYIKDTLYYDFQYILQPIIISMLALSILKLTSIFFVKELLGLTFKSILFLMKAKLMLYSPRASTLAIIFTSNPIYAYLQITHLLHMGGANSIV